LRGKHGNSSLVSTRDLRLGHLLEPLFERPLPPLRAGDVPVVAAEARNVGPHAVELLRLAHEILGTEVQSWRRPDLLAHESLVAGGMVDLRSHASHGVGAAH